VTLSLSERESAREIPERSFYAKDLCLRAGIIAGVSKAGVRTRNPERPEACRRESKDLLFDAIANLSKTKPPRNSQPKSLSAVSLLHHSQIVNEANYAFGDFLGFNFAYNQLPFPIY